MPTIHLDTEDPTKSPALEVNHVAPYTWNGWAVPVTTAQAFRAFIAAWRATDPDGTWRPQGVSDDGTTLIYDDDEHDEPDTWQAVGATADGAALYALDGWTWIEVAR